MTRFGFVSTFVHNGFVFMPNTWKEKFVSLDSFCAENKIVSVWKED